MPESQSETDPVPERASEQWHELHIRIPASWLHELRQAAEARALSVGALVRQLIRNLMLERPR